MESLQRIAGLLKSAKLSADIEILKILTEKNQRVYMWFTFVAQLAQIMSITLIMYKILMFF